MVFERPACICHPPLKQKYETLYEISLIFCPSVSKTSIFISDGLINVTRNTVAFTDAVLFKTSTLKAYSGGYKRHENSPGISEKVIINSYERSAAVLSLSFQ